jgi:DNA-binding response OmpR family regulator
MVLDSLLFMTAKTYQPGQFQAPLGDVRKRILVVDDEPAILFAYRRLLEKEGISVDVCETLAEASRYIDTHSYDAVVADLRLEGVDNTDGLEILKIMRERQQEAKVVLVTGYGGREIERTVLSLGAARYFEKPVTPATIVEAVKMLCVLGDESGLEH